MRVAVMFSGGKDSCQSLKWALDNGHEVEALISVKPKNNESFLYQYATVEWTRLSSEALGIPMIHVKSEKIGAREEADEMEPIFRNLNVDAVLMGGVGLQETQIRELRRVADKFGIKVLVPFQHMTSEELFDETINSGFDIMLTDVASDGLDEDWLGKRLNQDNAEVFKGLSNKFGFDILGEGGYYNTFVMDGPIFKKRIDILKSKKVWDKKTYSGYLEIEDAKLSSK